MNKRVKTMIDNLQSHFAVAEAKGWTRALGAWVVGFATLFIVMLTTDPVEGRVQTIVFEICQVFLGVGSLYWSYRFLFRDRLHKIMETFESENADVAKAIIYGCIFIAIGLVVMGAGM